MQLFNSGPGFIHKTSLVRTYKSIEVTLIFQCLLLHYKTLTITLVIAVYRALSVHIIPNNYY